MLLGGPKTPAKNREARTPTPWRQGRVSLAVTEKGRKGQPLTLTAVAVKVCKLLSCLGEETV